MAAEGPAEAPANIEGKFPSPALVEFPTIDAAPYNLVNPKKFAKRYSKFNRKQILQNYELANQIAMKELDAELAGLSKYAPAAAALKRQETSADNLYNQQNRTSQVESTLPGLREQLAAQGRRAEEMATGEIPDFLTDAEDKALELGIRSQSADQSNAGGFGSRSSVARKASNLMSAEARYQMGVNEYQLGFQRSQTGEQMLGSNAQLRAGLELAPTSYSDAGAQIRSTPEIGAGRLTAAALSETNQLTMLPTATAYQMKVQQEQYATSLEQQTRMFNATGMFNASLANASIENEFALDKFGYQVGYEGAVAGANTANNNTAMGLAQQQQAGQIFQDYANQAQQSAQVGAAAQGIGAIAPAVINGIAGAFAPSNTPSGYGDGTDTPAFNVDSGGDNIDFGVDGPSVGGEPISAPSGTPDIDVGGSIPDFDAGYGSGPDYSGSGGLDYGSATGDGGGYFRNASISGNSFQAATGVPFHASYDNSSDSTFRLAGISREATAIPGAVQMGANYQGQSIYSSPAMLDSQDATAGLSMGTTTAGLLMPLGAFDNEEVDTLNRISQISADPYVVASLDEAAARGDTKGFINQTLGAFGKGTVEDLAANPNKNAAATAYTAYNAMQNWTQMSPAQKGIMVAGFGLKATEFKDGKTLGEVVVPSTAKPGTVPVTIAKATEWFSKGINAYPLTKKWDQFNNIAKVVAGTDDPDTVAKIASQFKMLGAGTNGAEIAGVTAEKLKAAGWEPMPHLGVGAITASKDAKLPDGYTRVADMGDRVVAAPPGTAYSSKGAIMRMAAPAQPGQPQQPAQPGYARSAPTVAPQTAAPQTGAPQTAAPGQAPAVTPPIALQAGSPVAMAQNLFGWGIGAYNIYQMWQNRKPLPATLGTAGTVAGAVDKYNSQQAALQNNPALKTNYGQMVGSATQAYAAYEAAKKGNYVGAAGYGTAAAFNGTAAYYSAMAKAAKEAGNSAAASAASKSAAQYTQYAGYAQAGMNFVGAYQNWQQGDKVSAGLNVAGGAAELAGYGGAGLVASGAVMAYQGWGSGNTLNGAIGGSMMLAGTVMLVGGPAGWAIGGALMAASVIGNTIKTGTTNKEHIARNGIRNYLSDTSGFLGEKNSVTLADGSTFDMGQENDLGRHSVAHPELLSADQKSGSDDDRSGENKLRAYDIDYTNDLDFTSAMAGTTLLRLMAGGSDTAIDQMGNALGNAGIANIGYGQQMTKENFDKMMANQRGFYAKSGIGSKTDAYQLANAAFGEGRIDEMAHTQAIQSINMMYDANGYDTAKQLMSGRQKGVEVASQNANAAAQAAAGGNLKPPAEIPADSPIGQTVSNAAGGAPPEVGTIPVNGASGVPDNIVPDRGGRPEADGTTSPWFSGGDDPWDGEIEAVQGMDIKDIDVTPYARGTSALNMDKADVRALNASRYQTRAA